MSYRLFEDSKGSEWQVWDIVPRLEERRLGPATDRRVEIKVIPFADRRRSPRRIANTRRALLRGSFAHGWLCFESEHEKRRLSPIPDDWTTCDEDTLDAYLHEARPVVSPGRLMGLDSSDPPETPNRLAKRAS
jgi:hypothetical protein